MSTIGELFQTACWKSEKLVQVIECKDQVVADEVFEVQVSLGKEIDHPNTTEDHNRWIQLSSLPSSLRGSGGSTKKRRGDRQASSSLFGDHEKCSVTPFSSYPGYSTARERYTFRVRRCCRHRPF